MTKDDWIHLATAIFIFCVSVYVFSTPGWLLKVIFGILNLFLIYKIYELIAIPSPSREDVLVLLRSLLDDSKSKDVINGDSDRSDWDDFCDTPFLKNKSLNRIRLKCYNLTYRGDDYFMFEDDDPDTAMRITEKGKEAIKKLIVEVEDTM